MALDIIDDAARCAECLLAPLGNRWLHVQGVASKARQISSAFDADEARLLIAAAYLHDIGYAPALQKTGFHPLDGAYYLRSLGYYRLASLVAYHSDARFQARMRGLEQQLTMFAQERPVIADALTYCDFTTGPKGESLSLEERVQEIYTRYHEHSVEVQALREALPSLPLAVSHTQSRLLAYSLQVDIN